MDVVVWPNGSLSSPTTTFYVKIVNLSDREKHFSRAWTQIRIQIDDKTVHVPLSRSFWNSCPELRHKEITAWLKAKALIPWTKGKPPHLNLFLLGDSQFRLTTG
jgi:hypothetical protein